MSDSGRDADRYAVIGYPVAHSRSPVIHTVFAAQTGQRLRYEAIEVSPGDLEATLQKLVREGFRGLNVTMPHKSEIVRLVDDMSEHAASAGAINTVTNDGGRLHGDNTDGIGLVRDLLGNRQWPLEGRRLLILGAGGATRGIVRPLLEQGPANIRIANRSVDKAVALAAHFSSYGEVTSSRFRDLADEPPYDLVINATSAGLDGRRAGFPETIVGPATYCYDLAYGSGSTPFLNWAKEHGAAAAASGWGMLVEQAAESFRIWRSVLPDTADVLSRYDS
ncbi:MAG: shikimate dehydrogenase [Pseudomonadota bacterium]